MSSFPCSKKEIRFHVKGLFQRYENEALNEKTLFFTFDLFFRVTKLYYYLNFITNTLLIILLIN